MIEVERDEAENWDQTIFDGLKQRLLLLLVLLLLLLLLLRFNPEPFLKPTVLSNEIMKHEFTIFNFFIQVFFDKLFFIILFHSFVNPFIYIWDVCWITQELNPLLIHECVKHLNEVRLQSISFHRCRADLILARRIYFCTFSSTWGPFIPISISNFGNGINSFT